MQIKIVNYVATMNPTVQAFVDIEIDGWLRCKGLNLQRDGSLRSAQLTPWRNGKRVFRDAVEVLDADLNELLATDILTAISRHAEKLPPQEHIKAPLTAEQRALFNLRAKQKPEVNGPLAPPFRLMARRKGIAPRQGVRP
jgi:hypothetical protein